MKLTFLGATQTVTGSKYLIESAQRKILVDCGLFQGYKALRLKNWSPLPVQPKDIDAVILTHAHIDHSGYLPLLVKNGFTGYIYTTQATFDLCSILLPDSGHIHEEDAKKANLYGYSKHHPALPLYTKEDAERSLCQFKTIQFSKSFDLFDTFEITLRRAGHILGAAMAQIETEKTKCLFTGDLGRPLDPVMNPPDLVQDTDYLILESTYGDRLHDQSDPKDRLGSIIRETAKRGGSILIPAFAVGRSQAVLYYLQKLKEEGQIPNLPIYLDSPMAIDATKILQKHLGEHKLSYEQCEKTCHIAKYINTVEESKQIDQETMPKIIISASGMMTGGRILHHIKAYAPHSKHTILINGFQAGGTRGDRLLKGERVLKIHGKMVPINAHIEYLTNTSAHADYEEILQWLEGLKRFPRKVFITHGEHQASLSLKSKIESRFGWMCELPAYLDEKIL